MLLETFHQVSAQEDIWFGICCLVLGHPDILFVLSLHICLVSAQEDIWF